MVLFLKEAILKYKTFYCCYKESSFAMLLEKTEKHQENEVNDEEFN
jgi:hypothetical protein